MSIIKSFEDLQALGANSIHERTHIARAKLEQLLHKSFDELNRVQFMGFVSILEREYGVNLDSLRSEFDLYVGLHPDMAIAKPSVVLQASSNSRTWWIVGAFTAIVVLMVIGSMMQGVFSVSPKEEIMELSSTAIDVMDINSSDLNVSDVNATDEMNSTIEINATYLSQEQNKSIVSRQDSRGQQPWQGEHLRERLRSELAQAQGFGSPRLQSHVELRRGEESSNAADGLLVYGKDDSRLQADFARLVASDPTYGAGAAFRAAQDAYLEGHEGARVEGGSAEFLEMLEDQRRRLFFTLPDGEPGYPHWSMTAFRFAGDYLETIDALKAKRPVSDAVRGRIAKGLNRVLTGLLLENVDRIFIASSGGFTQSRVSVLCDHETPSRRQAGVGMAIRLVEETGRPLLDISLAAGPGNSVSFDLTPIRHEFLSRVAEGALPASFSNECLEDLLAFKAKLLRKAEIVRGATMAGDDDEAGGEASALTLNFIDIEPGGRGFAPSDCEGPAMSAIIKRPEIKSVDFCVDENIWGHRLYDEQLPHLTVLEFLGVLGSNLDRPLRLRRRGRRHRQIQTSAANPLGGGLAVQQPAIRQPGRP